MKLSISARQPIGWRALKTTLITIVLLTQTGCWYSFGANSMDSDIDAYNRQYVGIEKEMLLYNIGLLRDDQPPHFMMLSAIAQTRSFSSGASFQWTHLWNDLLIPFVSGPINGGSVTAKGSDSYAVGPFTAAVGENPTFTFTPVQGQEFANRFESSLTDKFTLFLQDSRWYATLDERAEVVNLFAQGLGLQHGDGLNCKGGVYKNRRPVDTSHKASEVYYYRDLSDCVDYIAERPNLDYTVIDAVGHKIATTAPKETPSGTEVVSALSSGYEWTRDGETNLANPVRLPAWLDYDPRFVPPTPTPTPTASTPTPLPVYWTNKDAMGKKGEKPDWHGLAYSLPPKYQWYDRGKGNYVLLPDGYSLDGNVLKKDSYPAVQVQPSYSDAIVQAVWPVPQDYFYFELRRQPDNQPQILTDAQVQKVCIDQAPTAASTSGPDLPGVSAAERRRLQESIAENPTGWSGAGPDPAPNVICGYVKVGHLLQILQRLAKLACAEMDRQGNVPDITSGNPKVTLQNDCSESIFGVGPSAPDWADSKAKYTHVDDNGRKVTQWIWVPAHSPKNDKPRADRDRRMFLLVYKLYQMSLVDTSKLVTGSVPVTISKPGGP